MTRKCTLACLLGFICAALFRAQADPPQDAQKPSQGQTSTGQPVVPPPPSDTPDIDPSQLPEEDESLKPKVYAFNPMESERDIKVGDFYMHKGTPSGYRAAAGRFGDATKYNPGSAEAFYKLGEAEQKLKHEDKAKAAFDKAAQLAAPDSKISKDARKKIAAIK